MSAAAAASSDTESLLLAKDGVVSAGQVSRKPWSQDLLTEDYDYYYYYYYYHYYPTLLLDLLLLLLLLTTTTTTIARRRFRRLAAGRCANLSKLQAALF